MNLSLSRRNFIGAAGTSALLTTTMVSNLAFAQEGGNDGNILVVLFQRGGCDGLNLVAPADDPNYIAARAENFRVLTSGDNAGLALKNSLGGTDFLFHPNAAGLHALYEDDQLAVIHAVGLDDPTRSHFVSMGLMERGIGNTGVAGAPNEGWLTRHIESIGLSGALPAMSGVGSLPDSFLGSTDAVAISNLDGGFGLFAGEHALNLARRLYQFGEGPVHEAGAKTISTIDTINENLTFDEAGEPVPYAPENGAEYAGNSDVATALKNVAQVIKMGVGLQAATVDMGGWDTHDNQVNRFDGLVSDLSASVNAFYTDLSDFHDRLTVVLMTEFGRRLVPNQSGGTDHGKGCVFMVLGGPVNGGRMYGAWPGLAASALDNGDLALGTDYRQVLGEVLSSHQGNHDIEYVFPGFTLSESLGLFTDTRLLAGTL